MNSDKIIEKINLKGHYDHDKLCYHLKMKIPLNIKIVKMAQNLLQSTDQKLINKAAQILSYRIKQYPNSYMNTDKKINFALATLQKIKNGKWNYIERISQQAKKLNTYYGEQIIDDIPTFKRLFKCEYCQIRQFNFKAALFSHQRNCIRKLQQENRINIQKQQNVLKNLQNQNLQNNSIKTKSLKVQIIKKEQVQIENQKQNDGENIFKRSNPYTINPDSIFQDE